MTDSESTQPDSPPPGNAGGPPDRGASPSGAAAPPPPRGPLGRWMDRHRHPANFWIHMLGIPLTIAAVPLAAGGRWFWAIVLFIVGYALQFVGHAIEGTPSGEEMLLRRLLGKR